MYVIMVYDVEVSRVGKVLKIARRYLNWVQNSVLEGELTPGQLYKLKMELKRVIDLSVDSVIFYELRTTAYFGRDVLGIEKALINQVF